MKWKFRGYTAVEWFIIAFFLQMFLYVSINWIDHLIANYRNYNWYVVMFRIHIRHNFSRMLVPFGHLCRIVWIIEINEDLFNDHITKFREMYDKWKNKRK